MQLGILAGAEAYCSDRATLHNVQCRGSSGRPPCSTSLGRSLKLIKNTKQRCFGTQLSGQSLASPRHRCMARVTAGADQVCSDCSCSSAVKLQSCVLTGSGFCRLSQPSPRLLQRLVLQSSPAVSADLSCTPCLHAPTLFHVCDAAGSGSELEPFMVWSLG